MQLTGDRFTSETAQLGNDISTLPNFPAEIRAPAGTLPGVSSFQVHFADTDILTPGDAPDVLVAMNPAALKANLPDLPGGGQIIVNTDEFTKRNLAKVGYDRNPLEDGSLDGYVVHPVALTSMTVGALAEVEISKKDAERAKNMFALGMLSARVRSGLPVVLGAYPITPASDILHELSKHKRFGIMTVQAEDEIAAVGVALGASYGGALGVTSTSGPGVALKSETISLAVALELPLVVIDVQRAGPSTGMPTKTEQADLNMALFGRHGEAPVAVIAARSPVDCFCAALEACRIALTYRTPVLLLSDGYIANGSEPWLLPDIEELPDLRVEFATAPNAEDGTTFLPYLRDPVTLARPWAIPGTPGLEHRIGGLEKADKTGDISYDSANHDFMVRTRAARIEAIKVPDLEVEDPDGDARVLVLGWGSTYGPIGAATRALRQRGMPIAQAHLRHLHPFPTNLGDVLKRYDKVVIPEMNLGQLAHVIRARYLIDAIPYNQVRGLPFTAAELESMLEEVVKNA